MFPAMLEPWVHSRWDLLQFLKFLELRERRRKQFHDDEQVIHRQSLEAVAALKK